MDIKRFCLESTFIILVIFIVQTLVAGEIYDDDDDENGNWNRCPWIRNKLKNGRVKIRSRGRIAKFLCEPGYELAGKRFATCVRGQWNNPLPVCVSRGCHRPPHVDNARVTLMYRGAVLTYDCLPGYTLEGGASIYCDGRRWSADPPSCAVSTSDPPTSCDFEDPDLCSWSHDPTHEFDWKRNQFSTPSGHAGTGPSFDHTFGEGKGGFYLFMEASSPRAVNDTARLFSPVYPDFYSGGCFIFWYHMFGSTTGGLRVYVKPESHVFGELPPAWALYGDQGNHWFRGNITLPQISENFQIIIEGVRGSSYIGDTAIDDVSLHDVECDSIGNSTDNTSETFSDSCRGRCRESSNSSACGCNDDCVALSSCCEDFESICTKNTEAETDETKKDKTVAVTTGTTKDGPLGTDIPVTPSLFSETVTPPVVFETTHINTKTTTVLAKDTSTNVSPSVIVSTTTPMENPTYPTTTISTSTSTVSTTTTSTKPSTTTTTPSINTNTSSTTTTTPSSTTTTPSSTTTTPSTTATTPSTTTTSPSTTTTTPSTTTATTTVSSTTTAPTTTIPTTEPSTTTMKATTSTVISTTSFPSTKQSIIIPLSASPSTTPSTTAYASWEISSTETPSTRRIYNLRPRNRTTIPFNNQPTTPTTTQIPSYKSTRSERPTTTKFAWPFVFSTSLPLTITTQSTTNTKFNTARPQIITVTGSPKVTIAPRESTEKFTFQYERSTEKSMMDLEAHASKTESVSNSGAPVVTIVSVVIVLLVCTTIGTLFFVRRWKAQKLSKLDDDSEMKFLSENEVVEYSDSSALDRINFNP